MINQPNIDNVYQNSYEEITENINYTNENDMFMWTKYEDKTKQQILKSKTVSLQRVQQIYKQQQEALRTMKILEENQKVMDRVSAKSGYVD